VSNWYVVNLDKLLTWWLLLLCCYSYSSTLLPPLLEQVGDTKLEFHRSGELKWMQHQEN